MLDLIDVTSFEPVTQANLKVTGAQIDSDVAAGADLQQVLAEFGHGSLFREPRIMANYSKAVRAMLVAEDIEREKAALRETFDETATGTVEMAVRPRRRM